jgi:DNA-binding beta-propeller fold protein YncE
MGSVWLAERLPSAAHAQAPYYLMQWGSYGAGNGQFRNPYGVATDAAGNVYVADWGNYRIQKFTNTGAYITQWGTYGTGDGQFDRPDGVATDAAGNVYVADIGNHRIQKFGAVPTPTQTTSWGRLKRMYR